MTFIHRSDLMTYLKNYYKSVVYMFVEKVNWSLILGKSGRVSIINFSGW